MTKKTLALLIIMFMITNLCLFATPPDFQGQSVIKETRTVMVDGSPKTVTVVWTNLNDPLIRVDAVLANGKVGQTAPLKVIVNSASNQDATAIAGINGTFFSAYTDMQAQGTLVKDGQVAHIINSGSVFSFNDLNQASVSDARIMIEGGTQNQWDWPYNWYAWNINHFYTTNDAVMIFDAQYQGTQPTHDFTGIKVEKGIVTAIKVGLFEIPADGFLVLAKDQKVIDVFKLGQTADFRYRYEDSLKNSITPIFSKVRTAVGAGPTLLKSGVIYADAAKEGFSESKITTNRAGRSIVGVTKEGYLGFSVLSNVTVLEAAKIGQALGMVDAMNLDGGGSSALYANGAYVSGPGRNISNALVVKRLKEPATTVKVNGQTLFFDAEPYLDKTANRTLVPLRGIAEALGAQVGWDQATSSITMTRYGKVIQLQMNSKTLVVDGVKTEMDMAVVSRGGRSFVPVRFITDVFGGQVTWDGQKKIVGLTIEKPEDYLKAAVSFHTEKKYTDAIRLYEKILKINPNDGFVLKQLADIYKIEKEYAKAITTYKRALVIEPQDTATLSSLAWTYYTSLAYHDAISTFDQVIKLSPDDSGGYYGQALCYSSYTLNNPQKAAEKFKIAMEKGLNQAQLKIATDFFTKHNISF